MNEVTVDCFVDSKQAGRFHDIPVISPGELKQKNIDSLIICSSFFNEIIPICIECGVKEESIFIVVDEHKSPIRLSDLISTSSNYYFYLPWLNLDEKLGRFLSNDIIYPDVYSELAKSVSYIFVSSVIGDIAEFGTCSGYSSSFLSNALAFYSKTMVKHETLHGTGGRKLHLFDSFQGFPKANKKEDIDSPHVSSGAWGEGTAKGLNSSQLKDLCCQFINNKQISLYEGWYKDTLPKISLDTTFALLHMDCDLYESTFEVLEYLFSNNLVSEGAQLLFDNWFSNRASKQFGEQKAWNDINEIFDISYTNLGIYGCVGNKIIVHHYKIRERQ